MKEAINKDSFVAREMENMAVLLTESAASTGQPMFDAERLTDKTEDLVNRILFPSKFKARFSIREMLSLAIQERWIRVLGERVINRNYLAVDNGMNLRSVIDAMVELDGKRFACKFRYVSSPELREADAKGPYAKHVLALNAECYMVHCFDGLVFYQHGEKCRVFHVNYSERLLEAVQRRCRQLNDYVLLGGVPTQKREGKDGG